MNVLNYVKRTQAYYRFVGFVLLVCFGVSQAHGHEINPVVIDAQLLENNRIEFALTLNLEAQLTGIAAEHDNTADALNVAEYDQLRGLFASELEARSSAWLETANELITLNSSSPVELTVSNLVIAPTGDLNEARDSVLTLVTTEPVFDNWNLGWDPALGNVAFRFSTNETQDIVTDFLQNGQESSLVMMDNLVPASAFDTFVEYIPVGFTHIVPLGLDHILFVIGLFLLSTHWKPLVWQVTAFTLAHSITLALGMLGLVRVSGSIVEPLIALSIVYVAFENITSRELRWWRPVVIFAFGLLHGLGFASVLTDFGLSQQAFVAGLIGFNVGVEVGQLTVIAACYLAVGMWFSKRSGYRKWVIVPGSSLIAATGAFWFLQRVLS